MHQRQLIALAKAVVLFALVAAEGLLIASSSAECAGTVTCADALEQRAVQWARLRDASG